MTVDLAPFRAARALLAGPPVHPRRAEWLTKARAKQITPDGDWATWLLMTGRGWGKTETGAQDMAHYARTHPGAECAIIGRTEREVGRVCIEGPTGILQALDRTERKYNASVGNRLITLTNGSKIYIGSADSPDGFLGTNLDRVWADELAAWRYPQTWYQGILPALRNRATNGGRPQAVITTTPRTNDLVRSLMADSGTHLTRGASIENAANLAPGFINEMKRRLPERLVRQEIYGELLEDVVGALWTRRQIEDDRRTEIAYPHTLRRAYVGVDPSDANGEGDEMGLACTGLGWDHDLYVVESEGCSDGVTDALRRAVLMAVRWSATIILEKNHGGAFLEATLRQVLRDMDVVVGYQLVSASDGKRTRAEPVAALYEQHRVHHVGQFDGLEDQMCSWVGGKSPDRLDALVWSVHPLLGDALKAPSGAPALARGWSDETSPVPGGVVGWS